MINWTGVSPKNGKLELKELTPEMLEALVSPENLDVKGDNITIGFIDLECNGLEYTTDEVIEIGIKSYLVNRKTGRLGKLVDEYNGLQEIEEPLKQKVINITGITEEDLKGQKIDWHKVTSIVDECDYVIAHNASYDRNFVDIRIPSSRKKIWGCSLTQIDWVKKGFHSAALWALNIAHGFFYQGHRSINDIEATVYLLQQKDDGGDTCYLKELIDVIDLPQTILIADKFPFPKKNVLKDNGYHWAGDIKCWFKTILHEGVLKDEVEWLEKKVYEGINHSYTVKISNTDTFKSFKELVKLYKSGFKSLQEFTKDWELAISPPYEKKDMVKSRGYRWKNDRKVWAFYGDEESVNKEIAWIKNVFINNITAEEYRKLDPVKKKLKN